MSVFPNAPEKKVLNIEGLACRSLALVKVSPVKCCYVALVHRSRMLLSTQGICDGKLLAVGGLVQSNGVPSGKNVYYIQWAYIVSLENWFIDVDLKSRLLLNTHVF